MRINFATLLYLALYTPRAFSGDVILMVNMNYSAHELQALDEAAAARNQRVEMVPPRELIAVAEPMFKQHGSLEAEIKRERPDWNKVQLRSALYEIMRKGSRYGGDPGLVRALSPEMDKLHDLAEELSEKEQKLGSIYDQLRAKANELKRGGHRVDSLAFSSHSDGSNLTGESANRLSASDLFHLKRENPEIFHDPRHVLLLGCYNLTKTNGERWRYDFFPNASMLAGYGVRAPSRYDPISPAFIREMIGTAHRLDREMVEAASVLDPKLVQDAFFRLRTFTNATYPGVVDYCSQVIEGRPGTRDVNCDQQWEILFNQAQKIRDNYLNLRNLTQNPPLDGDGGELRAFYNTMQSTCSARDARLLTADQKRQYERFRTSTRESVIRLIFWWSVQQNFHTYFEKEIATFDRRLLSLGIRSRIPPLNGNLGRVEFVHAYNAVRQELLSRIDQIGPQRLTDTRAQLIQRMDLKETLAQMKLYDPLYFLQGEDSVGDGERTSVEHTLKLGGIPFNWIEGATARSQ